uniref:CSON014013 protein n=1 Tax=Culicoides sonorensis TaxID=179676 RepID=A0A336MF24_CULSO
MITTRNSTTSEPYCRICFSTKTATQDLAPFVPIIQNIAQTKIPYENDGKCKICTSCAHGLIMANLFRVKVIQSNADYRNFMKSRDLTKIVSAKQGHVQLKEEEPSEPEDDEMEVEFLNEEFLSDEENEVEIPFEEEDEDEKPTKMVKIETPKKLITIPKSNLKEMPSLENIKILSRVTVTKTPPPKTTVKGKSSPQTNKKSDGKPEIIRGCYICTEPPNLKNSLTPHLSTLKRVIGDLRDAKNSDHLCDICMKKVKDAKLFFTKLDKVTDRKNNTNCCTFCASNLTGYRLSQHNMKTFNSLPIGAVNFKVEGNEKMCPQCVQLLSRIRMIKNCYSMKIQYIERKKQSLKKMSSKKQALISKILQGDNDEESLLEFEEEIGLPTYAPTTIPDSPAKVRRDKKHIEPGEIVEFSDELSEDEEIPLITSYTHSPQSKKRRIRIRAKPRYVRPNPDEPIPEDYQCHMSDFEEIDSDYELPPVKFRFPLNVPFKHTYLDCPHCSHKFVNSCELEVHIETMHETTSAKCNLCNQQLANITAAKQHKWALHYPEFSAFNFKKLCHICGVLMKKMDDHITTHTMIRAFACEQCEYKAKTKSSLRDHVQAIHLGEKRHKCKYCDKRFSYGADKHRHEISAHTKNYKHICPVCAKCFVKKNFMTNHIKSAHGNYIKNEPNAGGEQLFKYEY